MDDKEKLYETLANDSNAREQTVTFGKDNSISIVVKPTINYSMRLRMIKDIVSLVIQKNSDGTETYCPDMCEFAKRYFVINYFTNVELPQNIDEAWLLLRYTNLFDAVYDICQPFCDDVLRAAEEEIRFKRNVLEKNSGILSELNKMIQSIRAQLQEVTPEKMQEILEKLKELNLPQEGVTTDAVVNAIVDRQNKIENN